MGLSKESQLVCQCGSFFGVQLRGSYPKTVPPRSSPEGGPEAHEEWARRGQGGPRLVKQQKIGFTPGINHRVANREARGEDPTQAVYPRLPRGEQHMRGSTNVVRRTTELLMCNIDRRQPHGASMTSHLPGCHTPARRGLGLKGHESWIPSHAQRTGPRQTHRETGPVMVRWG